MLLVLIPLYLCSYLDLIVNLEINNGNASKGSESRESREIDKLYPTIRAYNLGPYHELCAIPLTVTASAKPLRHGKKKEKTGIVIQSKEQKHLPHQNYQLIHIMGQPHVMDNSLGHKHSVQKNEILLDLAVYIGLTHLLTSKFSQTTINLSTLIPYSDSNM